MSKVLQDLEKSRQVVRKKYQKLKRLRGIAQQEVTRTLEPLITPLQNIVKPEVGRDGLGERELWKQEWKRELEQPGGSRETEEDDSEPVDDFSDATAVADVEDFGDDVALTSTPKLPAKPFFTHGISSLLDTTVKKRPSNNGLSSRYLHELVSKRDNDHTYGPTLNAETNKLMLGNQPLEVEGDVIRVGNQSFAGTVGLFELIFKNNPQNVEPSDEEKYAKIM